ncbi:hypothetical protein FN846DRAFT_894406 [Sphaerosporella brunnea]|uniref:Uncharacterized protein n=1 Tax=Sphaerosporella brunnea TaxID=1250544 RepID=A0A5J5EJ95_9PEZI|nr:hypothetical protein FN846DRAFT_894406 [Sphaerosporella brunnea]
MHTNQTISPVQALATRKKRPPLHPITQQRPPTYPTTPPHHTAPNPLQRNQTSHLPSHSSKIPSPQRSRPYTLSPHQNQNPLTHTANPALVTRDHGAHPCLQNNSPATPRPPTNTGHGWFQTPSTMLTPQTGQPRGAHSITYPHRPYAHKSNTPTH